MSKIKLRKRLIDILQQMYAQGKGKSKHQAKLDNTDYNCIYSIGTLNAYKKQINFFVDDCYNLGIRDISSARAYVPYYLTDQINKKLSASTIHLRAFALAKVFGCNVSDFGIDLPTRERKDYTRSRYDAVRDSHFSVTRNKDLIDFCTATGLRRAELEKCRGTDLREIDGKMYIYVANGKGGKSRMAEIYATDKVKQRIKSKCDFAQEGLLFPHVPDCMDVHSYRSAYCNRVYNYHSRPLDTLSPSQKYYCRKDRRGDVFDRDAMLIASQNLGHNRIDVIAQSYLR